MMNQSGASATARCRHRSPGSVSALRLAPPLFAVALLVSAALLSGTRTPGSWNGMETTTVILSAGDSLWSVAQSHRIEGLDTAETVRLIQELNGIESPVVRAGSSLVVPLAGLQQSRVAMN